MAGAVRRRRPEDFMYPLVEGGGLNRGDSVRWGVWILSLPEHKGKGRGKSCSQGRLWAIIICPGPQRKSDNPHVNTIKDTEIIGICQFSRREVCLICESMVHKKKPIKNVEMLMFFISRVWCSLIQHWAFCPNDFLLWDIAQSWSSLWSLMRTEQHPRSTKTRTPTAGNDWKGFLGVFFPNVTCQ